MNKLLVRNLIRTVFILIVQLLLLKRNLTLGEFNYIHLTIYSLIIALLPYKTPKILVVAIGFSLGLFVDLFYDSLGVHAGATTLVAYCRSFILYWIAPTEGYKKDGLTPYAYGIPWFLTYMSLMIFFHLITLYSLEAFSFVYIQEIMLRTIFSTIASLFFVMFGSLIFNPKY